MARRNVPRSDAASRLTSQLSRRERQIMDAIYRLGNGSASEIARHLPDPPTDTAVRTLLRILERKGYLRHTREGLRHVYSPVVPQQQANRTVLQHVLQNFFQGSRSQAMAALLDLPLPLADEELDRLSQMIERARKRRG
jgi:predicted transcriptional regulator